VIGILIGWVDTRPTWDDAGVTAAAILSVAAILGAAAPQRAWVWALAVGGSTVLLNVALRNSFGSVVALVFAFVGAFAGAFVRKAISSDK
jgi:hypothetical protein